MDSSVKIWANRKGMKKGEKGVRNGEGDKEEEKGLEGGRELADFSPEASTT